MIKKNELQILSVISIALIHLTTVAPATAQPLNLERITAKTDSIVNIHLSPGIIPGMSVAIARDGKIVFSRGYGEADVEMGVAAGPETIYRIGSITKQFTAAAIMRLVEAGEITLDDPLTKFLPDYPTQGQKVTVRHLLTHTSGIRNITSIDRGYLQREFRLDLTDEELLDLFAGLPFNFEPGTQYSYTNSGYLLLGMIIEKVTGKSYPEYIEHELLEPLGLNHTLYCENSRVIANRAEGYSYEEDKLINSRYLSMRIPGGAGALCSTVGDLVRWTHLLHGGQVVSPTSLQQMTDSTTLATGERISYGFGLDVGKIFSHPVVQHGGGISGFSGMLTHYPDDGLTLAVLTNTSPGEADEIAIALARAAFGMELINLPLKSEEIARYEGAYTVTMQSRTLDVEVFGKGEHLIMRIAGGWDSVLLYQGDHAFIPAEDHDLRVAFSFSTENERAEEIILHQEDQAFEGKRSAQ